MLDFTRFTAAFPDEGPTPYDQSGVRSIETFRKGFDGVLFIDRVLRALGIGQGKLYPPKGDSGLRSLHKQICESKVSSHHKLSVLYYLLLDFDDVRGTTHSQLAEALVEESALPKKYQILMRGLWHMDRKEFKFALEHLAHPSLPSEFADEIIIALVRHADAGVHDYTLPLGYYNATQPVLKTSEALELLFGALSQTSIADALTFSRSYPQPARQRMFEQLVASVVGDPRDAACKGKQLVSLSLTGTEEKWFLEYLTGGDGKKSKNAKLVLQMRQVVTGRDRNPLALSGFVQTVKTGRAGW